MPTDAELLDAWRDGDRRAGKLLFARYFTAVNRFFRNKVGSESQDLVQKTFLACVEGVDRYRGEGSFRSWLFAVAYKQLCKHYRAKAKEQAHLDLQRVSAYEFDGTPSRMLARKREERLLLEALRRIPVDFQVALELRYWEQMTDVEIAATLDLPLGTFKSRIRRARQLVTEQVTFLAASPEELQSTISSLEDWAEQLRDITTADS
ncbi:RNA polymerase sigma factor [Pseudenhygromyxa sp. WMMC2535]|uniref:RNA polymerase sigma factor n=1 Tax=Pseudenhygromyxa sp. WMMC2535 TaxID=2712867 RepID=UPI001553E8AE|nr:RNA polymerase sigma factor [Pseudenhygromyxa sp. WMMC2535]NVB40722.1 RNA polymerase sigma factor [Pseudenhygromyxa sp. WMMC2535]